MSDLEIYQNEINSFLNSKTRRDIKKAYEYYGGIQDIRNKKKEAIGEDSQMVEITNVPNNKTVNNQFARLVDQKNNYLLGKPFTLQCDCENCDYETALKGIFNKKFQRMFHKLGKDALISGTAFLYQYISHGKLVFKVFDPRNLIPIWKDEDKLQLDSLIRIYTVKEYEGKQQKDVTMAEIYKLSGVEYYKLKGQALEYIGKSNYIKMSNQEYNWSTLPVIAFKANEIGQSLLNKVKCLQDSLNTMYSLFLDNMEEDPRNTVLVVQNYDGEDLGAFRKNLALWGVIPVNSSDNLKGGVEKLTIEVNSENYKTIIEALKKTIIENGRGFDVKDERMTGSPNQMNIESMYSEIELDANEQELQFQAALEDVIETVNTYLALSGKGDYTQEDIEIDFIFNRDMMMNETDIINNIKSSVGILSKETLIAQHPWVDDVQSELERIAKEEKTLSDAENTYPENFK